MNRAETRIKTLWISTSCCCTNIADKTSTSPITRTMLIKFIWDWMDCQVEIVFKSTCFLQTSQLHRQETPYRGQLFSHHSRWSRCHTFQPSWNHSLGKRSLWSRSQQLTTQDKGLKSCNSYKCGRRISQWIHLRGTECQAQQDTVSFSTKTSKASRLCKKILLMTQIHRISWVSRVSSLTNQKWNLFRVHNWMPRKQKEPWR